MKKKTYLAPEMKVVVLDQADIIATSEQSTFEIQSGTGYEEEDW